MKMTIAEILEKVEGIDRIVKDLQERGNINTIDDACDLLEEYRAHILSVKVDI